MIYLHLFDSCEQLKMESVQPDICSYCTAAFFKGLRCMFHMLFIT